jgi:hypothetical protein
MTAPDWLTARAGGLAKGLNDRTVLVTLNGHPMWRLDTVPSRGEFTCVVLQTNSGKRMDDGKGYPTQEAAFAGGLEELRAKLGW